MQTVPLNGVVDCVVRNAYTKLIDKQQVPSYNRFEFLNLTLLGREDHLPKSCMRVLIDNVIDRNFAP